ncbi:BspA family leucine-rich repeat surface protein [Ichthyobacterium seriolicida]|uniref:PKD domain-containing protein n=1 Tax=Ichthyobacterium seriolicida TaxID=242600 RepID=A0A1J1EB72_9FLAO|nr:BspA family leucine-rich repeat surface protein [Ichthyobacterium seriolicida]BAV94768.1 hypothetical protein JBKA6_0755 [Ichthyobacterium seriolicida]
MKKKILLFCLFSFQAALFTRCVKNEKVEDVLSNIISISSLKFDSAENEGLVEEDVSVNFDPNDSTKISVILPYKKRELITKLVPKIEFSGKRIDPDPSTINDFSSPVSFKITSEKGDSKTYTVTVSTLEASSENKILSFSLDILASLGLSTSIDHDNSQIVISSSTEKVFSYYELEKIKNIVPSIEISELASISDNSKVIDLLSISAEPTEYVVTSESRELRTYRLIGDYKLKEFVSKWNPITTYISYSENKDVKLPIYEGGDYDFTVDWGDGTEKQIVTSHDSPGATHRYATGGEKTVTITGKIEGFNFKKVTDSKEQIIEISSWGDLKFGNAGGYLKDCEKLSSLPSECPDLEGVTDLSETFYGARVFNDDISNWNVSKVENMSGMFRNALAFDKELNAWDVSSVTNMSEMFKGADAFNQNIGDWDVSSVTNMESMFGGTKVFNQGLNKWKVDNVTNMESMFSSAKSFNQDLNDWKVENVTNMSSMFSGGYNITVAFNGDISNWNVSKVENMSNMFERASSFNRDISNWDVSSVTNMYRMFSSGWTGASIPFNQDISGWDVRKVTNCNGFSKNTSNFTNNKPSFSNCNSN